MLLDGTSKRAECVTAALGREYTVLPVSHLSFKSLLLGSSRASAPTLRRTTRQGVNISGLFHFVVNSKPDAVYCVADIVGFVLVYPISRILGFRMVYEAHAVAHLEVAQVSSARSNFYKLLEYVVGRSADSIVALSAPAYRFFKALNPKTAYVPVFVDLPRSKPSTRRSDGRKTVGLIGPFDSFVNSYQLEFLERHLGEMDSRIEFVAIGSVARKTRSEKIKYLGYLQSNDAYYRSLNDLDALPSSCSTWDVRPEEQDSRSDGTLLARFYDASRNLRYVICEGRGEHIRVQ